MFLRYFVAREFLKPDQNDQTEQGDQTDQDDYTNRNDQTDQDDHTNQVDRLNWGDQITHSHWIEYERCGGRTVKHAKLPISSFDESVSQSDTIINQCKRC